ncbi:MoaD/ThiS family protein [Corynebacterium senegalense]|uniref:MoaD/ThiS family protein n=1 Tax=Corynebacterium senegalense TaxID=2080750 RepID=UPI0015F27F26|nr:MoaD/ThiS family protein [Corynebacterium senegalense]
MRIHYFAAARAAAGVREEEVGEFPTLGHLLDDATSRHTGTTDAGLSLADVVERCTFLVDGARAGRDRSLESAARVDVLPPFAGG